MHRIEVKLKTGETCYIGTMSDFGMATDIVKGIWKSGFFSKEHGKIFIADDIAEIHLTTYLGTKRND